MNSERFNRQDFLGNGASAKLATVRVGIVGLGGGGSHVVQQLAHVGVKNWVICDNDRIEESNLNRLVGATAADVRKRVYKTAIARRVIRGISPDAIVEVLTKKWQEETDLLATCDVVIGGVDTFSGRHELEAFCRQRLIPYIDVGLDVHEVDTEAPRMTGQVIVSMPGAVCMHCMGFLTPEKLSREALKYGGGGRPQVVWANGVLGSTAAGLFVDLVTGWTESTWSSVFLSYDANISEMRPDRRWLMVKDSTCPHYPLAYAGLPKLIIL